MLNIYLISQNENVSYDSYDAAVVAAIDENTAKCIDPETGAIIDDFYSNFRKNGTWCSDIKYIDCQLIGAAAKDIEQGVICASYNAG